MKQEGLVLTVLPPGSAVASIPRNEKRLAVAIVASLPFGYCTGERWRVQGILRVEAVTLKHGIPRRAYAPSGVFYGLWPILTYSGIPSVTPY